MNKEKLPILLIVCGPPGVGKSTVSNEVLKKINFIYISLSNIRKRIFGNLLNFTPEQSERTYRKMVDIVVDNIKNHQSVLVDGTFLSTEARQKLYIIEDELKNVKYKRIIISLIASTGDISRRIKDRDSSHPDKDVDQKKAIKLLKKYLPIKGSFLIDTSLNDLQTTVEKIMRILQRCVN